MLTLVNDNSVKSINAALLSIFSVLEPLSNKKTTSSNSTSGKTLTNLRDELTELTVQVNNLASNVNNLSSQLAAMALDIAGKQDELSSGENIKTINGNSILGSGDLIVP